MGLGKKKLTLVRARCYPHAWSSSGRLFLCIRERIMARRVAIVGVGLLGGSLGLALKARDAATRIVGVGRRQSSLDEALSTGAVDEVTLDPAEGVRGADLVVLCTPVCTFEPVIQRIAPALSPKALVTDVGSTKAQAVRVAERLLKGKARFVGSHPIAGSERSGPAFARADLYDGKLCILTPTARSDAEALDALDALWRSVGMRTVRMSPAAHDKALARVSHLPHAVAALLVDVQRAKQLDLAGTGFIDATRIAGGDPAMWRDICLTNRSALLAAVDEMAGALAQFRALVHAGDGAGLETLFQSAQAKRAEMLEKRMREQRLEG